MDRLFHVGGVIPCPLAAADLSGISVRHGGIHKPCEARSKRRSPRSGTPSPLCCRTLVRAPIGGYGMGQLITSAVMVVLVRLTVLGACGAWPEAGQAGGGYLVGDGGVLLRVGAGCGV